MHRAVLAEGLGSMLLTTAVIGSGIMAQGLTGDSAVALLANALSTVAALAGFALTRGLFGCDALRSADAKIAVE